ncbi:MAG TPA: hypothetical protein VK957_23095 [Lunatimonas sp.]|nr:hypothetical protein [Lunatimonas sp.]
MMEILELKHKSRFRENYLEPAMKNGWIERTIPDKPQNKNKALALLNPEWQKN